MVYMDSDMTPASSAYTGEDVITNHLIWGVTLQNCSWLWSSTRLLAREEGFRASWKLLVKKNREERRGDGVSIRLGQALEPTSNLSDLKLDSEPVHSPCPSQGSGEGCAPRGFSVSRLTAWSPSRGCQVWGIVRAMAPTPCTPVSSQLCRSLPHSLITPTGKRAQKVSCAI